MGSAERVLVCVLSVLGRSVESLPPIHFVAAPPPGVSRHAEAYVTSGTIHLVTSAPVFQRVQRASGWCGDLEARRKLASIVIHEEWHVKHGAGEAEAYNAQLLTLLRLGSGPGRPEYQDVWRSMRTVLAARRAAR
jgi:hypothetical protein